MATKRQEKIKKVKKLFKKKDSKVKGIPRPLKSYSKRIGKRITIRLGGQR